MKRLDPGHLFELLTLDGPDKPQFLYFVKREGKGYPGNKGTYPGTNMQSVIRALIDRTMYLIQQADILGDKQTHDEDVAIINNLSNCLYLLEHRAMRRHGLDANSLTMFDAVHGPMCPKCGHVHCPHEKTDR